MYNKLSNVITHAYQTVPYYKKIFEESGVDPACIREKCDLERVPLLRKEIIVSNQSEFLSNVYVKEELFLEHTSGSTGIPLRVFKSKKDKIAQGYILWKWRNKLFGIDTHSNYCTWHIKGPNVYKNNNRLQFSALKIDEDNLKIYAEELYKYRPEWLFGGAETWYILADFMKRQGIKPPNSIKFIESTGEFLSKDIAKELEDFFDCAVIDMYGCIEIYGIARADTNSNLQILDENVMVEIVNEKGLLVDKGEYGQIALTSLNNMAMPFIRYLIGDIGRIITVDDGVGKKIDCLELKSARINERVSIKDSSTIDASVFHFVIERMNRDESVGIKQFKVVQKDYTSFVIYLNLANKNQLTKEEIRQRLLYELSFYKLDIYDWEIKIVNRIGINNLTGKYQYYVNEIRSQ